MAISTAPEKKVSKTKAAILALGLMVSGGSAVADNTKTDIQELIAQCDVNWDWIISNRKTYKNDGVTKEVAKKEYKCSLNKELQEAQEELQKLKEIEWLLEQK